MTEYPRILYYPDAGTEQLFVLAESETPPDPPDPPEPTEEAVAVLVLDGQEYVFNANLGEELDPYYDPQGEFIQRCIRCTHPDLGGFVAWYRPDMDSDREEWVFELGSWNGVIASANLPAYSMHIGKRDGSEEVVEAPSGHYWFARWRWQSSPRPVRRTYAALAAQHLIPHFNCAGIATGPILSVAAYTPMACCGMPTNMGATGGYPGLGILTGWIAQYLVRNAPEDAWRSQAEAINSYPTHVRDPDSHGPMDIINIWPNATMYSSSEGNPYIPKGPAPTRTDQGHLPSVSYVPWLLTGDPYYLESMQFTTNYQILSQPGDSRWMVMGRYLAWPCRAFAELVASCPDVVPSWLLPRSYWLHWLDDARDRIEDRVANQVDPYCYIFHSIVEGGQTTLEDPSKSGDHVWQQAFLDLVAAWIACSRDEWIEPAEWLIHSCIARASATSGWVRARPSPYHMRLQHCSVLALPMSKTDTQLELQYGQLGFRAGVQVTIDKEVMTLQTPCDAIGLLWSVSRTAPADHAKDKAVYGPKCLSWGEAADLNVDTYDWDDCGDNSCLSPETEDLTYASYQRAALAQALVAGLGVPELTDAYTWLDGEIRHWVANEKLPVGDNWAIVPDAGRRRRIVRRSDQASGDWIIEHRED